MKGRLPIGLRLTLWYFVMFAAAQAIFGLGMWSILRYNLYDIADDALEAQVDDLQNFLTIHKPGDLQNDLQNTYASKHSGEYLLVTNEQGPVLYRGPKSESPALKVSQLSNPLYEDRRVDGKPIRVLAESLQIEGRQYIVQVGAPEGDVLETLALFRRYLLLFAPFLLFMASAGGYWLSRRALAPVDVLTRTAAKITGTNLSSRLEPLHTGDELQRLSDTLNDMLVRIETQFLHVSQFTADASHELRTPIALIRTEAEIALRKSRDEGEYREALQHVLLEAEKTSTLIETLLSIARADAGREALNMRTLDLRDLCGHAAQECRPAIEGKALLFSQNLGDAPILVSGDQTALQRLLNILLDNAFKYTPSPGRIELSLHHAGQTAVIKVCDTGIGISPEDQPRIFERFYRADKARTREQGGVGLGLAIAKWIVEQHQGQVALDSAPGKGSTFTVELPQLGAQGGRRV